jgi:hypothetical protein
MGEGEDDLVDHAVFSYGAGNLGDLLSRSSGQWPMNQV